MGDPAPGQRLNQMLLDRRAVQAYRAAGQRWLARLQEIERRQGDIEELFVLADRNRWYAQSERFQITKLGLLAEMRSLQAPSALSSVQSAWDLMCDLRQEAEESALLSIVQNAAGAEADPELVARAVRRLNDAREAERRWQALALAAEMR